MADSIATAYVTIEPTFEGVAGKLKSGLGDASESAGQSAGKSFSSGLGSVIGGAGKVMAGAVAAGGAALTAMGASFVSASGDVASYGDNIDKMSQKMGISAQAYQEWDAIMQHSGTSIEALKPSMKTLASQAEKGNEAFQKLGISEQELASLSQEDLFSRVITGLQGMEEGTERTYLTSQLLGKGATELGALLNTSAEDTEAMRQRVHELGGVMSDDAVKAAAAYQDQLQDMQTAFSGLSRNLMAEFLPGMTTVMAGLTEIFSGNTEGGIGMISEGITGIATKLTEALPTLLEVGASIISALGEAIIQNLPILLSTGLSILQQLSQGLLTAIPTMLPTIIEFVTSLGTMIIENLPLLIQAATQIILQLALGLAQALPELIPTIIEVILAISMYLIENIDLLIDAAIQLIMGLANGLIAALPVLIEKAPEIIMAIVNGLIANIPKLLAAALQLIIALGQGLIQNLPLLKQKGIELVTNLKNALVEAAKKLTEVGKSLVEGIKKGISDAWDGFRDWVLGLLNGMVDAVKAFFGIGSPSKLMADEIGQWIPAGIAKGIEDGMDVLNSAVGDMATDVVMGAQITASDIPQTMWSQAEDDEHDALYELLATYLPGIASNSEHKIVLEGGLDRLFRAMQRESARNSQIVGPGVAPLTT